jgi:hypothetical protein
MGAIATARSGACALRLRALALQLSSDRKKQLSSVKAIYDPGTIATKRRSSLEVNVLVRTGVLSQIKG